MSLDRCFPHVVNISVKHGLKGLTDVSPTVPPQAASTSSGATALSEAVASAALLNCRLPGLDTHSLSDSAFAAEESELLNAITSSSLLTTDAELNAALQADEDYADALAQDPAGVAGDRAQVLHLEPERGVGDPGGQRRVDGAAERRVEDRVLRVVGAVRDGQVVAHVRRDGPLPLVHGVDVVGGHRTGVDEDLAGLPDGLVLARRRPRHLDLVDGQDVAHGGAALLVRLRSGGPLRTAARSTS